MKIYPPSTWNDGSPVIDEGESMELTDKQANQIEETHDTVLQLRTVLLGINGNPGLVAEFKAICEELKLIKADQDKLDKRFWILIAFLIGSGIIGGVSIWELLK